jgi:putative tryptophan/tyrosine transport system substrate-binding protein
MRRREFIALLGGATVPWPFPARAQQKGKAWRIGYLSGRSLPSDTSRSFVQGLRELGYVEGEGLLVEYRTAKGRNEQLFEFAADLVRARVDLIVTEGTPSTKAAMLATNAIPIVFGSAQDPVEKGIVASLAHPGGNVTGNALIADHSKPLELLKETFPGASHVAFIYDPATRPGAYGEAKLKEIQNQARTLHMIVQPVALRAPDEVDKVFTTLPADTNALLLENSVINLLAAERICALSAQRGLPAVGTLHEFAGAGCLFSYGEKLLDSYRRAASYADKIFRGAKPADLPVQQAVTFELLVNLRTAKALGLTIPETFLIGADEVIE